MRSSTGTCENVNADPVSKTGHHLTHKKDWKRKRRIKKKGKPKIGTAIRNHDKEARKCIRVCSLPSQ